MPAPERTELMDILGEPDRFPVGTIFKCEGHRYYAKANNTYYVIVGVTTQLYADGEFDTYEVRECKSSTGEIYMNNNAPMLFRVKYIHEDIGLYGKWTVHRLGDGSTARAVEASYTKRMSEIVERIATARRLIAEQESYIKLWEREYDLLEKGHQKDYPERYK